MKIPACFLVIIISALPVFAAEGGKLELLNEFFLVTDVRGTLEKLRQDNVAQARAALLREVGEQANDPLMQRFVNRAMEKYTDYSEEIFGWAKWEKRYILLYEDLFSEKELEGIVAFYRTEAGRAMIRAQPEIGKRMQQQMFANATSGESGARVQAIMNEAMTEVQDEVRKERAQE